MEITVSDFLEAKFGRTREATFEIVRYRDEDKDIGNLESLLLEFKDVLLSKNLGQARNPRSGQYILVDKDSGTIIGAFEKPVI